MKTYNNVEDLYREKFSDYSPEPPAEVWERIQQPKDKTLSVKGKATVVAVAVVVTATLSYWGINKLSPAENMLESQHNEQIIAANNISETSDIEGNETVVPQKDILVETSREKVEIIGVCMPVEDETSDVSTQNNSFPAEPNNQNLAVYTISPKAEREVAEENTKTAVAPAKPLPIVVSKDTTICKDSTVKLFILNAKDVRWSTGETKNTIFVNPSSDEQFSVSFTTENNQDTTVSIHIKCLPCSELFIPSAFTPNGDGLNDFFIAKSEEEYSYFVMEIYSRNGTLLFTSKDINRGWDGFHKGVLQPHGSYTYLIRYKDAFGKMHNKKGEFLLLLY